MIQNENDFLEYVNAEMGYEEIIGTIKKHGANQMTCMKVIRLIFKIRLSEADAIVQNSIHWKLHKDGNEDIKDKWFKG